MNDSPDERKLREHLSDPSSVGGWLDADRHELTIALEHPVVSDTSAGELLADLGEMILVARVKRDRDGTGRDTRWRRLAGGVDGLGDLRPMGEICPDDDVVRDRKVLGAPVVSEALSGVTVNACLTW